jgi:hypothetical protein
MPLLCTAHSRQLTKKSHLKIPRTPRPHESPVPFSVICDTLLTRDHIAAMHATARLAFGRDRESYFRACGNKVHDPKVKVTVVVVASLKEWYQC